MLKTWCQIPQHNEIKAKAGTSLERRETICPITQEISLCKSTKRKQACTKILLNDGTAPNNSNRIRMELFPNGLCSRCSTASLQGIQIRARRSAELYSTPPVLQNKRLVPSLHTLTRHTQKNMPPLQKSSIIIIQNAV